jgi:polyisoprenoid-binding protein YceI
MKRVVLIFSTLLLFVPALADAAIWEIDSNHSSAQFMVRHLMVSNVKGEFRVSGAIDIDDKDITKSKINVTIDAASVNTGVEMRDADLKSANFFDVAKFPVMTFVSKKITNMGKGKLKITGDLTLHGVTRAIVLDVDGPSAAVKDPWGKLRRGASAKAKLNRRDYGLTYNKVIESGGVVIGDDVAINIDVEFTKK